MPVFYQQQKAKFGTTTGTIIAWPLDLISDDPADLDNAAKLPAGYLRCDGSVKNASVYPALADILGTGDATVFKQPGTTVQSTQFQLPDLRSKYPKGSGNSNQGLINNVYVTNAAGQTISKAGIGVSIVSNVGNSTTLQFSGNFRVPQQTVSLLGDVGFTKSKYTEQEAVVIQNIAPHVHYTNTSRSRIKPANTNIYVEQNYYTNASTIGVDNWFDATGQAGSGQYNSGQPACNMYIVGQSSNEDNLETSYGLCTASYWQVCYGSCNGMIQNCLVPAGKTYSFSFTVEATQTCGLIVTTFSLGQSGSVSGNGSNGYNSSSTKVGSDTIPQSGTNGYSHTAKLNNVLPFDPSADTTTYAYPTISNVVEPTDDFDYETDPTIHKHTITYTIDTQAFKATTEELFVPTDGLKASITVQPENTVKLDDMVPPFTLVEYLIKI